MHVIFCGSDIFYYLIDSRIIDYLENKENTN
jgi:hypothetical protein